MSCPAVLVCAVSGSSVAVQDEPCLSLAAAPVCCRPHTWRQCVAALSGNWCARRRLKYVCFSCRAGPHGQVPGPRPRVDAEGGPDPPSPPGGQKIGDYRSLCWFGWGLCESRSNSVVTPAGWYPRGVRVHRRARTARAGWALVGGCGIQGLPQALCPATAQVQDSEDSLGLVCPTWWSSLREPRCPRGGGVAWAGVLAASATASEEPWMLALCVQVLSRDPCPGGHS